MIESENGKHQLIIIGFEEIKKLKRTKKYNQNRRYKRKNHDTPNRNK